ncbi:MAG: hypothetical protein DRJ56_07395 [Thermoprotei archaeon]|nr:MAG: hypothetical protein DRJ56_07395 [Thermoprotei archaeon]
MHRLAGALVLTPWLRVYCSLAARELVKLANALRASTILLPLPAEREGALEEYLRGSLRLSDLVAALRAASPASSAYASMEPILASLRGVARLGASIRCYGSLSAESRRVGALVSLLSLVAALRAHGRVGAERVMHTLSEYARAIGGEGRRETERVLRIVASVRGPWIVVAGLGGRSMLGALRRLGPVRVVYAAPYVFTPLERLIRLHATRGVGLDEALELLREHADFLWGYVRTSRDASEGYRRWLRDKYPDVYSRLISKLYQ